MKRISRPFCLMETNSYDSGMILRLLILLVLLLLPLLAFGCAGEVEPVPAPGAPGPSPNGPGFVLGEPETAREYTEAELGMPFLPGARWAGSGRSEGPEGPEIEQVFLSDGDFAAAQAFYDERLPAGEGWRHRKSLRPDGKEAEYRKVMGGMLHRAIVRTAEDGVEIRLALVYPGPDDEG